MRLAFALTVLGCVFGMTWQAWAGPPWEDQFMAAPARDVLDAAARVDAPADSEVVLLLEERKVEYAATGAAHRVYRSVYQVRSAAAVQQWSEAQTSWEPWIEDRPSLRARVVTSDGRTFALDPKTIETTTPNGQGGDIYTDRSLLRAPLPGIARGAVVELEIDTHEKTPMFDRGMVESFVFVSGVQTQKARLVVDAPVSLPIKFVLTNGSGIERTERRSADHVVTQFEAGPLVARDPLFPNSPPDLYRSSFVTYTTGQSWQRAAERYADLVNEKLRAVDGDVRAWTREATARHKGRDAVVAALVTRLRQQIRYTGLEFGESSIVPHPPAEVFARRFGDCKDQAVVMVALLRDAGIEAHVALLSAGTGHDVDPALPGLGPFNHAIVYVPAKGSAGQDLWIDPVARFVPPGELPLTDQGRLALVARTGTTKLIKTPVAPSTANLTREERDLTLSEDGQVTLKERTTYWGAQAAHTRSGFAVSDRKDVDKNLGDYAVEQYKAKKLASSSFSEPTDLEHPFTLSLNIEGADLGYVGGELAQIELRMAHLFSALPDEVRDAEAAAKSLPRQLKERKRTADFVYPLPFTHELAYRITPAHGFVVQSLPTPEDRSFGSARLRSSYSTGKNGIVEAHFRFDSGSNRLTPQELAKFQEAFKEFGKTSVPVVRFSLAAEKELAAGRIKTALAAFRQLDQEHPNTAHHTTQLARALLLAGLGEAARREAGRATALDLKSGEAWRMLGTVLEHDLLGRAMKPGFDPAGIEAAFRKAIEIDGNDAMALRELAIMAEYDDHGEHTWPERRLKEAKAAHERHRKLADKSSQHEVNYLITMFRLGEYRQVLDTARAWPKTVGVPGLAVAATAMIKTAAEAIRQTPELVPDSEERPEALRQAGAELLAIRRYPESLALFTEAARTHKQAPQIRQFVEIVRQTKRRETLVLDERDPRQLVAAYLVSLANDGADTRRFFAEGELPPEFDMAALKQAFRSGLSRAFLNKIPLSVLLDFAASRERRQEGDPRWGVWIRTPGVDNALFAVPRDGKFRLLLSGNDWSAALAREAGRRLDKHDLDGGRYLLGKLAEQPATATADDPLSVSPFTVLWQTGDRQDEHQLRLMALVAEDSPARDRELLPLVETCIVKQSGSLRDVCERVSVNLLWRLDRKADAQKAMEQLAVRFPGSRIAQLRLAGLFTAGKEWDNATAILKKMLQTKPDDDEVLFQLHNILLAKDQLGQALDLLGKGLATGRKSDLFHNNIAWTMLYLPTVDERALEHARQAVSLTQRRRSDSLHTLATVLAELGRPEEARQTLLEMFEVDGIEIPRSIDWYIIGRIAEEYGERQTALAAYRKVERPDPSNPLTTFRLAERRIRILEGKTK